MSKFLLSTPGIVLMGIGALVVLWIFGKLVGASFFFIATLVIVFLIVLVSYLVIHLVDEPLLEKIKNCLSGPDSKNEEQK
jgi:high-affinity Fe2+/Pb2+ permease